jgi:two-component system, sensor histidine kinase LadS
MSLVRKINDSCRNCQGAILRLVISCFFVLCAIHLLFVPVCAIEPIVLVDDHDEYQIGRYVEILRDADEKWTIDDVTSPEISVLFAQSQKEGPFVSGMYWMRFSVTNQCSDSFEWLLLDHYGGKHPNDLFSPKDAGPSSGRWDIQSVGTRIPFREWKVKSSKPVVFRLSIEPGETKTFYLRASTPYSTRNPLAIQSGTGYAVFDHNRQIMMGIFVGVVSVMVFYNLFLFFSLKDRAYFYYTLMLRTILLSNDVILSLWTKTS